jgi:hypothetical protein
MLPYRLSYYIEYPSKFFKDAFRPIKYWWQRKTRGYDNLQLWNTGPAIIKFGYPLIKAYVEMDKCGHPMGMSREEWDGILQKILFAFEASNLEETDFFKYLDLEYDKRHKEIQEGFELFGKYIQTMWD